jgi:hypothetical protein
MLENPDITFLTQDALIDVFEDAPDKSNPLYEQDRRKLNTTNNIKASKTLVSYLEANNDPRLEDLFEANSSGEVEGLLQGNHEAPSTEIDPNSISKAAIEATDPVYFISAAESYFLQAEAQLRFGDATLVEGLFQNGMAASFPGTDTLYSYPNGDFEANFKAIMMQKWAALAGVNNIEAFFEINRTGYPEQSPVAGDDAAYVPGELTDPINSVLPAGQRPLRMPYPNVELSRNSNAPELVDITSPVWWDKN